MGIPPSLRMGAPLSGRMGVIPNQEGWGTFPIGWMGILPAGVNRLKILPSVILRMRTVMKGDEFSAYCKCYADGTLFASY